MGKALLNVFLLLPFTLLKHSYASHSSSTTSKSSLFPTQHRPWPPPPSEACQLHYQTGAGLTHSSSPEQPWWKRVIPSHQCAEPSTSAPSQSPPTHSWLVPRVSTPKHRMILFPETDKTEPCKWNIDILAPSTAVSVNNCQNQSLKLISIFLLLDLSLLKYYLNWLASKKSDCVWVWGRN